jgi:hypothetical protein
MNQYIDYLFEDQETGERFFVELKKDKPIKELREEAWETARANFEEPLLVGVFSAYDAEKLGYDTY